MAHPIPLVHYIHRTVCRFQENEITYKSFFNSASSLNSRNVMKASVKWNERIPWLVNRHNNLLHLVSIYSFLSKLNLNTKAQIDVATFGELSGTLALHSL